MSERDILNQNYWLELRTHTRVNGQVGNLKCMDWCEDVLKKAPGFKLVSVEVGDIQIDQYATSILSHHWLEINQDGHTFIADGTAGQFDSKFPDGYYGDLENAPETLKLIYLKQKAINN